MVNAGLRSACRMCFLDTTKLASNSDLQRRNPEAGVTQGFSSEQISKKIYFIRDHRVMLDADLAALYEVKTGNLNKAVRRNKSRFPEDCMFQLTEIEEKNLIFQNGISSLNAGKYGGRRHFPYAFTEQGVAMLSGVLKSDKAILVNIEIMRTFVKIREILLSNQDLARKLVTLEKKFDTQFRTVFDAIRQLMEPRPIVRKRIGIVNDD